MWRVAKREQMLTIFHEMRVTFSIVAASPAPVRLLTSLRDALPGTRAQVAPQQVATAITQKAKPVLNNPNCSAEAVSTDKEED